MTREIKFRAWNKRDKKMHEVFGITTISVCYEENAMMPAYEKLSNDIILMQYTGLKDKNGKEIYEGDIIEVDWEDSRYKKHNVKVNWNDTDLCWEIEGGCLTSDNHHFEIIGNIYENPKLLSNNLLKSDEK